LDDINANLSEQRFLPPSLAVSTVIFALRPPADAVGAEPGAGADHTLWLPLVRRIREPFLGCWALPGSQPSWDQTLEDSALMTLAETTGTLPDYIEQLYTFGAKERSASAQRLVTIAYWVLLSEGALRQAPEAENVSWFPADELPELAFDHARIIAYALGRLRSKTEYSAVAHRFLGTVFTLQQLRGVTEAILGRTVDPANFRRQALAEGHLIDTGQLESGGSGRPARLYHFKAN